MNGAPLQHQLIQLVVNYWEIHINEIPGMLDDFLERGVNSVTSFVPWQCFESDIAHRLMRFLITAADRGIKVHLVLSPEVGVHYPFSGLPKDVLKDGNCAQGSDGEKISSWMPPRAFSLPSLFSEEFNKRYHGFLARMQGFLQDLDRSHSRVSQNLEVVLTGSFWKYYRAASVSHLDPFGGLAGDRSKNASSAYRQTVEEFYSQKEFSEPDRSAANRWKTQRFDEVNRRYFYQVSEEVYRNRCRHLIQRRGLAFAVNEIELYTPEADPAFLYSGLLARLSEGHSDFYRISKYLDSISGRLSARPYVHWSSMGGFRRLSDAEKQFLILKSLILMGGRDGGIYLDIQDWFQLSQGFRAKTENLARMLSSKKLSLKTRAIYFTSHLWSSGGTLWEEMSRQAGPSAQMCASLESLLDNEEAYLAVVDPGLMIQVDSLRKMLQWARKGRVLALPRGVLFTEAARRELEEAMKEGKKLSIHHGVSYHLTGIGAGKLIVYETMDQERMQGELLAAWQKFMTGILSLAEIQPVCQLSDGRLAAIPLALPESRQDWVALFVLNGTGRPVEADLFFRSSVSISDFAQKIHEGELQAREFLAGIDEGGSSASLAAARKKGKESEAKRFHLEVPPCGVLPFIVEGLSLEAEERHQAGLLSDITQTSIHDSAFLELPGFDPNQEMTFN
jgi:hypothetical protein